MKTKHNCWTEVRADLVKKIFNGSLLSLIFALIFTVATMLSIFLLVLSAALLSPLISWIFTGKTDVYVGLLNSLARLSLIIGILVGFASAIYSIIWINNTSKKDLK